VGDDEDGPTYTIDFTVDVKTEKDDHDVVFQKADIKPSSVDCNRRVTISYTVKNIGGKDEDAVQVSVENEDLDFFKNVFIDELQEGDYDDDDTEYEQSYSFTVPEDMTAGTYPFTFIAEFDDGDEEERTDIDLVVNECKDDESDEEDTEIVEDSEEDTEVVIIPSPQQPPTQKPVVATPVETTTEVSFTASVWFIVLLVVAVIVLLSIALWMLSLVFRK